MPILKSSERCVSRGLPIGRFVAVAACLALPTVGMIECCAQEPGSEAPKPAATTSDKTADDADSRPAAPKPSATDSKLLDELFPGLPRTDSSNSGDKPGELPDELERAVKSMRDVSSRLEKRDVSEETTKLQTSVLDDIDALLKKLKNPPPSQPQDSTSNSDDQDQQQQNQQQDRQQQQNQDQTSRNQQRQNQSAQQKSAQRQGTQAGQQATQSERSEESSEKNARQAREREIELARRRALIDEVWGHLPPAVRERLLNVGSEKLIPKYESLIRRYYESLAETVDPRQPVRRPTGR
jgi:hypothetical protein